MPDKQQNNTAHSNTAAHRQHGFTNAIVKAFLNSSLSLILILLAIAVGLTALFVTPREEDPQIIVPLADVHVSFPGHSAEEVEQLISTPLEKLLYHIDGVEYVYSQSRRDAAIITVRFYVGEDRERSLVKLNKSIDEHISDVPAGVTGWTVKPIEIDDVPIITLTLTSDTADSHTLRRVGEEMSERLAGIENISRAYVVGGEPRQVQVYLDPERMRGYSVSPLEVQRAIQSSNITHTAGDFTRNDAIIQIETGTALAHAKELPELVVGVYKGVPVFLKDVADIKDGPAEVTSYVRHGWGPARGSSHEHGFTGTLIGQASDETDTASINPVSRPAVTIALAKKKGTNAVWVADEILNVASQLKQDIVPDNIDVVVTRNYGLTADHKVNELVEALAVAVILVILVLSLGLGWREAIIVALAVPVVFGLTLTVNMLFGFTINRVTLFALILSIGLLVDDPIVDVENITRHFGLRKKATREIVLEAVAEIRPPLITATLAVIVSFLPMFFITGMMGPYMRPMALNVPIAMVMSMVVAFTITPWLSYHLLKSKYKHGTVPEGHGGDDDLEQIKQSALYKFFYPLMAPLLKSRTTAILFLLSMAGLTVLAAGLAATRDVPLKMLPFDNKNELLLVLDFDEGTTLERADTGVKALERHLAQVPEVTDFTAYTGLSSPMDFNGMVRHYYLRQGPHLAEIRINLAEKFARRQQSHAIGLRLHDDLAAIAHTHGATLKLVETPPGPPVISTIVAEVYGQSDHTYTDLIGAARVVRKRLEAEPHVIDIDDTTEALYTKYVFVTDKEKAAINGISTEEIAETLRLALAGSNVGIIHEPHERNPLDIQLRLPRDKRSDIHALTRLYVKSRNDALVAIAELGSWHEHTVEQTIHHKNLKPVVYVFAETAGRAPAEAIVDIQADRTDSPTPTQASAATLMPQGWVATAAAKPLQGRTFINNGSNVAWHINDGFMIDFAGEGEWQITLDVFRDLGLAFAAALVGIYILLVAQTGSFAIPGVVMLAIPLTILGIMPGFWLLNLLTAGTVGQYADPTFFTATGMIGMIALAGIVTRDSIILVDFIHLSLGKGRSLFDAIMESRVVRLRPILLTAGTAMLSAVPITIDPIFSGLAWSLIFGLLASTLFTLFVIPITYWLVYANKPGHGLPVLDE